MSSEFNFEEWIDANNFDEVKDILIEHDLNVTNNLCTQSEQFQLLLSEPKLHKLLETNTNLVTNIFKAVQQLSFAKTAKDANPVKPSSYIVISEEEEDILKLFQSILDELKVQQLFNKELNQKYMRSITDLQHRRKKQIENTKNKINSYFDKLFNEILSKKQSLLKELEASKQENVDERKENQILSESEMLTETAKCQLSQGLNECNHILQTSSNMDRNQRKKQIININEETIKQYNEIKKVLNRNAELIENGIQENKSIVFDIDFEINMQLTQNIIDALNCIQLNGQNDVEGFGETAIINREGMNLAIKKYQDIVSKQEDIINQQTIEIKAYRTSINDLEQQISRLQREIKVNEIKQCALKMIKKKDFSFLSMYAREHSINEPNYKYKSMIDVFGGTIWEATMQFDGVKTTHHDNTKKGARLKCIRFFVHNYM